MLIEEKYILCSVIPFCYTLCGFMFLCSLDRLFRLLGAEDMVTCLSTAEESALLFPGGPLLVAGVRLLSSSFFRGKDPGRSPVPAERAPGEGLVSPCCSALPLWFPDLSPGKAVGHPRCRPPRQAGRAATAGGGMVYLEPERSDFFSLFCPNNGLGSQCFSFFVCPRTHFCQTVTLWCPRG